MESKNFKECHFTAHCVLSVIHYKFISLPRLPKLMITDYNKVGFASEVVVSFSGRLKEQEKFPL